MEESIRFPTTIFLWILLAGVSCNLLDSGEDDKRTYPHALNLQMVTLSQIQTKVVPPDSLNTVAYVTSRISCPPDAACILPDGIMVADTPGDTVTANHLLLPVKNPLQFKERRQYLFSLEVKEGTPGHRFYTLLGYSKTK